MAILPRYVLRQAVGPFLLSTGLACALIWTLQAMRIGHHLVGAPSLFGAVLSALALSLPSLLLFTVPVTLAGAIVFALMRLRERRQWQAMLFTGASPLQLIHGVVVLLVTVGGLLWVVGDWIEPAAVRALYRQLVHDGTRAWLFQTRSKQFHQIGPYSLYGDQVRRTNQGIRVRGLLLANDSASQVLTAERAWLRAGHAGQIQLHIIGGELRLGHTGSETRIRFGQMDHTVALASALDRHFSFVARMPVSSEGRAAACLALGLLALALGCGTLCRGQSYAIAALAMLAQELACWRLSATSSPSLGLVPPVVTAAIALVMLCVQSFAARRRKPSGSSAIASTPASVQRLGKTKAVDQL